MHLTLSPQAGLPGAPETTISVHGDIITIDGLDCDLSKVPEGGKGWPEDPESPLIGPVCRIDGTLHLGLRVSLGATAAENQPTDPAL